MRTGTYAEWMAVDESLVEGEKKFRAVYATGADQEMDRATLNMRIADLEKLPLPPEPAPPATEPPTVKDVPYASQQGSTLNCTMGNWNGEPTSYAYQWQRDGTAVVVGGAAADYTVTANDVGHSFTCVVTATNALGSAAAPPSNAVVAA
jgi:hypothetical protein